MEKLEERPIEATANYEGNTTLLLLERVQNPAIRAQILDLLFKSEKLKEGTLVDRFLMKDGRMVRDDKGEPIITHVPYVPTSLKELEEGLDATIKDAATFTEVSFSSDPHKMSSTWAIEMNAISPWGNKPFNEKQMSIIEAHEKGHHMRDYTGPFFETYFKNALHFDSSSITLEDVEIFRKGDEEQKDKSPDEIRDIYIKYMSDGREIAERMSQLKNYFGMSGNDIFTREHLQYAREHYVKDTDLDNGMRVFFEAIKPETEEEFIRLINCSGI